MTIDAPCPNCGTVYTVRRDLLGKRTKCTHCGTPFVIAEMAPAQAPPVSPPPPPEPGVFPDLPIHPTYAPHVKPPTEGQASQRRNPTGEFFGFEQDQSRPRFPAMRRVARAYEIMAVIVLVIAACLLVLFFVSVFLEPRAIIAAILSSGVAFAWAFVTALMFLFVSQAIRLGLQIEQNTRETQQSCRQLAEHLCAIQVDK